MKLNYLVLIGVFCPFFHIYSENDNDFDESLLIVIRIEYHIFIKHRINILLTESNVYC